MVRPGLEIVGIDSRSVRRTERHTVATLRSAAMRHKHQRGFEKHITARIEQTVTSQCRLQKAPRGRSIRT